MVLKAFMAIYTGFIFKKFIMLQGDSNSSFTFASDFDKLGKINFKKLELNIFHSIMNGKTNVAYDATSPEVTKFIKVSVQHLHYDYTVNPPISNFHDQDSYPARLCTADDFSKNQFTRETYEGLERYMTSHWLCHDDMDKMYLEGNQD